MKVKIEELKAKFKTDSQNYPKGLPIRLHRAISWLKEAEARKTDLDFCFISLWIAFNAIYADELSDLGERSNFRSFLTKIVQLDSRKFLESLVWDIFSNNTRILLDNQFTFQPFWDAYNQFGAEKAKGKWEKAFEDEKHSVKVAISKQKTARLLHIVFRRLYTVRNQIIHGGATYNSSKNISQKKDACQFLLNILPVIVEIMMENYNEDWGKPYYPVVN